MSENTNHKSAFYKNDQEEKVVEFDGDVVDAIVLDVSAEDAKKAAALAGGQDMSLAEFQIAKVICCTLRKDNREPYFDESDFKSLMQARGDARKRLEKLMVKVTNSDDLGNL
jgi:hypothetical protein